MNPVTFEVDYSQLDFELRPYTFTWNSTVYQQCSDTNHVYNKILNIKQNTKLTHRRSSQMHFLHFQSNILNEHFKNSLFSYSNNKIAPEIAFLKKLPLNHLGKIKLNSSCKNTTMLSAPSSRERKLL